MKKFFYRVQKGETARQIADKFSVCVFSIIKNNLLDLEIEEGDILEIERAENSYKVLPNEDMKTISSKLGVSVEKLNEINKNPPYLFYGLILNY